MINGRFPSRRLLAGALVLSVTFAACSGDDDGPSGAGGGDFDPVAAAEALEALGTVRVEGEIERGDETEAVAATFDYANDRADAELGVHTSQGLVSVGYRRDGADAWLRRAPMPAELRGTPGSVSNDLLVLRASDDAPWLPFPPDGLLGVVRPYEPVALLRAAAEAGASFEPVDGERGSYTAGVTGARQLGLQLNSVTVRVRDGVPVAVRVSLVGRAVLRYDITPTGGEALAVEPPSPDEVSTPATIPVPEGPFDVVATVDAGGVAVEVLRAEPGEGWTCWRVASDPPYVPISTNADPETLCIPAVEFDAPDPTDRIGYPLDATGGSPYELLGLIVPDASAVTVMLADGSRRDVAVGPGGLALVAGPAEPPAAFVFVVLPGGDELYCAPGEIILPSDVDRLRPDQVEALSSQPWNCLAAEDALLFAED